MESTLVQTIWCILYETIKKVINTCTLLEEPAENQPAFWFPPTLYQLHNGFFGS